ncbi:hypothetical protein N657DRAFT_447265 [Parathielavia appendiculata]|uniref:Uncharacterized protein n=1 Tax=Parathielavia appendiculata TaxID=2587402 RepID=A0AAN6U0I2_9PEZI|nr:hypothetical protein N657DRAFT_447265 [Parathielavia appendiculata]
MESFNEAEKRFVLAEMIKLSQVDVGVLVDFVKSHGIEPDWLHMQLPSGRTMGQCLHAAETMFNTPMAPPPMISSLKRKSLGDLPDFESSKRQAMASPGEVSPRGFALPANLQPGLPANIQPRPNGFAPAPSAPIPSVSASTYNPTPVARKRGRPPKAVQGATWQVSTYPPITPAPIAPSPATTTAPHPRSPGLQQPPAAPQAASQGQDTKPRKKALPEIAPRPTLGAPGSETTVRSPAAAGGENQFWRDETSRREYYQAQGADAPVSAKDRPTSTYAPILPRPHSPRSPLPPPRELVRPASAGPRHDFREPLPTAAPEPLKNESRPATTEPIKT